ncbi:MAG: hypothetical protein GX085_00115 [Firmicutes bacterium]|nr:hypothetical protein [Bacillota bacterium]
MRSSGRRAGIFAVCLAFFFVAPVFAGVEPVTGDPLQPGKKAVVLFLGGLSFADWQAAEMPHFKALAERGAVGLMNVRTAGAFGPENAYATFNAGERALGSPEAGEVLQTGEAYEMSTAGEVFARRTGGTPPPGALLVMDWPRLFKNNTALPIVLGLGTFGETMAQGGVRVAVLGNADTPAGPGREIALAAMNTSGIVPRGEVDSGLSRPNPLRPWGLETDYRRLHAALVGLLPEADCLLVELGDSSRVEKYRDYLLPGRRRECRLQALAAADRFLGALLAEIDLDRTVLFIVTPYPSRDAVDQGDTLTPVLAAGPGFERGLLFSPSTRQPGIIAFSDLAATLFAAFRIKSPPGFPGRPLTCVPEDFPIQTLVEKNHRVVRVNNARGPVLKGFVLIQIALFLLVLLFILHPRFRRPRFFSLLQFLLSGITGIPLGLLVLPWFGTPGVPGITIFLLAVVFGAGWAGKMRIFHGQKTRATIPALLGLVTSLAVLVDIFRGSPLMSHSLLGFSPVGGARYYGIGNEYLGVLLGGSVTGLTFLWDQAGRGVPAARGKIHPCIMPVISAILYVLWLYAVAAPWRGANLGGAIALAVTYLVTGFSFSGRRFSVRQRLLLVLAGVTGLLFLLGLSELHRAPGVQSHLGQLVTLLRAEGPAAAVPVIWRKLKMNLTLMEYTVWSRVFLTFLIVLAVLFFRPGEKTAGIDRRFPALAKGVRGALAGSITALAVNDSGIVAAATGLLFPVVLLTMIILEDYAYDQDQA